MRKYVYWILSFLLLMNTYKYYQSDIYMIKLQSGMFLLMLVFLLHLIFKHHLEFNQYSSILISFFLLFLVACLLIPLGMASLVGFVLSIILNLVLILGKYPFDKNTMKWSFISILIWALLSIYFHSFMPLYEFKFMEDIILQLKPSTIEPEDIK